MLHGLTSSYSYPICVNSLFHLSLSFSQSHTQHTQCLPLSLRIAHISLWQLQREVLALRISKRISMVFHINTQIFFCCCCFVRLFVLVERREWGKVRNEEKKKSTRLFIAGSKCIQSNETKYNKSPTIANVHSITKPTKNNNKILW